MNLNKIDKTVLFVKIGRWGFMENKTNINQSLNFVLVSNYSSPNGH